MPVPAVQPARRALGAINMTLTPRRECPRDSWSRSTKRLAALSWSDKFDEPIDLSKGKPLITLRDAALYITKLPNAEHDAKEWQAAMEALILVAKRNGPTMFARIGVMKALNRHAERVFNPDRKDHHWGERKLARDR
jgi:hypothetical protein